MRMKKTPKLSKFNLIWASPKDKVMKESKITNLYLLIDVDTETKTLFQDSSPIIEVSNEMTSVNQEKDARNKKESEPLKDDQSDNNRVTWDFMFLLLFPLFFLVFNTGYWLHYNLVGALDM